MASDQKIKRKCINMTNISKQLSLWTERLITKVVSIVCNYINERGVLMTYTNICDKLLFGLRKISRTKFLLGFFLPHLK